MATIGFYSSPEWRALRELALDRDGSRCTVARLLGGECTGRLHVHHIIPICDGGHALELDNTGTACAGHHPQWEALRRNLARTVRVEVPCPECDARLGAGRGFRFRTAAALADHRRDVHGVGLPVPDRDLNLRMVRELVDRLHDQTRDQIAA